MLSYFDRAQIEYYLFLCRIQYETNTAEEKDNLIKEEKKLLYEDFTEEQIKELDRLTNKSSSMNN